ncbi:MAG: hypothetical protein V7607_5834 [Solirubrobacteraceae bacterium]
MLRTSAVGVVVAFVFAGAAVAHGQRGTTSYPEELWKAYPLEQRPATQAKPPASQRRPAAGSTAKDSSGSPLWWLVGAAAGAALVLVAVSTDRRRKARLRRAKPDLSLPTSWPAAPAVTPRPARPSRPSDPVCQIRWSHSGGFFFAVTTGRDGADRGIARSPRVDWTGPAPPEQEPELEAALRVLSKQLRELGWRPLRAKGFDFDERRWYARRFRWPTEVEAERPGSEPTRGRAGEQVGMHAKRGNA